MTDTITLPLHNVEIDRGTAVITVEVPEHEIRVLRAVHGVAEVPDKGESDDERDFDANADAEWDRLVRTYKRPNMQDAVQIAYPTVAPPPFGCQGGRSILSCAHARHPRERRSAGVCVIRACRWPTCLRKVPRMGRAPRPCVTSAERDLGRA